MPIRAAIGFAWLGHYEIEFTPCTKNRSPPATPFLAAGALPCRSTGPVYNNGDPASTSYALLAQRLQQRPPPQARLDLLYRGRGSNHRVQSADSRRDALSTLQRPGCASSLWTQPPARSSGRSIRSQPQSASGALTGGVACWNEN